MTLEQKLIGMIAFSRADVSELFSMGYWLAPSFWGQGFMTEAGTAMLTHLEQTLGPQKTVSGYFAHNPTSGRVLQKLGYKQTGTNEMYCAGHDKTLPHVLLERSASG